MNTPGYKTFVKYYSIFDVDRDPEIYDKHKTADALEMRRNRNTTSTRTPRMNRIRFRLIEQSSSKLIFMIKVYV